MTSRRQILIVEDDDDIRETLSWLLAEEGFQVDEARDGLDALERLRTSARPGVVLLDMMMPRLDGEGFMRVMKGVPELASVPFIIMSGHNEARQKAAQLGAAACLVKPIEFGDLLAHLRELTSSERSPLSSPGMPTG